MPSGSCFVCKYAQKPHDLLWLLFLGNIELERQGSALIFSLHLGYIGFFVKSFV